MPSVPSRPARIEAALQRLALLHPKLIDLSLDRITAFLRRLGHPERRLPPVVHVAGTNGKGSLLAYLRAMLEAAGYRVHVYTSPHLVRFNERIRLAGAIVTDEHLADLLDRIEEANSGAPITFFEVTTAAAFLAFAEVPADIVLLETGLGGRLDATNVVERPLLTAITPISLDHMDFLGHTIGAIAREKAGILKRFVPAVIGPQPPEAAREIEAVAGRLAAPLARHGREWSVGLEAGELCWQERGERLRLPPPALAGSHQIGNAGSAIAAARRLAGFRIEQAAMAAGLRQVEWPARLQRLVRGPLLAELPPEAELWLDGGHNPAAGAALAGMLSDWRSMDPRPRPQVLVIGMKTSKDLAGFLAPLAAHADRVYGIAIPGDTACCHPAAIAAAAASAGLAAAPADSAAAALRDLARATVGRPPRVLICGSLYLAGSILADHG